MCRINPMELEGSATRVGNTSLNKIGRKDRAVLARIKKYILEVKSVSNRYDDIRKEMESLIAIGEKLDQYLTKDEVGKFLANYQQWYTKSLESIRQLIPNRLDDFKMIYKNEKRKSTAYTERDISQYLSGDMIPEQYIALKILQQRNILISAYERLDSILYEIKDIVQADIFDSELETARFLMRQGFLRASGAICGVLIEKHFETVLSNHNLKISKKDPGINDYNENLKNAGIIKTEMWRFIQRMGDLRNLCDHNKKQEPSKENVADLIDGTDKIIKTIY